VFFGLAVPGIQAELPLSLGGGGTILAPLGNFTRVSSLSGGLHADLSLKPLPDSPLTLNADASFLANATTVADTGLLSMGLGFGASWPLIDDLVGRVSARLSLGYGLLVHIAVGEWEGTDGVTTTFLDQYICFGIPVFYELAPGAGPFLRPEALLFFEEENLGTMLGLQIGWRMGLGGGES
jgi:hypothetical protein